MERIIGVDKKNAKTVWEMHECLDYIGIVIFTDVFESCGNIYLEIQELNPPHYISIPGLVCQVCFKKT